MLEKNFPINLVQRFLIGSISLSCMCKFFYHLLAFYTSTYLPFTHQPTCLLHINLLAFDDFSELADLLGYYIGANPVVWIANVCQKRVKTRSKRVFFAHLPTYLPTCLLICIATPTATAKATVKSLLLGMQLKIRLGLHCLSHYD